MLNSIGGDLQRSLGKAGISKQIEAVQVCDMWEKIIGKIFGEQVAGQTQAMYFKNGTLAVAVLSPVLAQEFKFKEEEIIKEINRGRSDKVRKIRFEI
jgi:predicted nucleic acid-binding Zn ribbon protein